jgi:[acyl-carrier-protein] S-malonyltransferase
MNIVCVFSGPGAQSVGMLSELIQRFRTIRGTFEETSDIPSIGFWSIVTQGTEHKFNTTSNLQLIILAAGVAVWRVGTSQPRCYLYIMAGHSFGEYTALVCVGAFEFREQAYSDRSLTAICVQDSDSYERAMPRGGEVS